jgi:histidyl-tRNA synthetase
MSESRLLKSIRGTRDLLPGETEAWDVVEGVVREVMALYQYREIRTPIFEETQIFARGIGEHTDIVSKEMYTFEDQGGRSLTLRPEGTAPVVRAYLEHKLAAQGTLDKFYYMGPMFRQEAPQKGRTRQFHQFGAEIIGTDAPEADAEIILLFLAVIDALGLDSWKLHIGSLGCRECRPAYREELVAFLKGVEDLLCEDCRGRIDTNPLRILDCKKEGCRLATAKAPHQIDFLDPECLEHFNEVKTLLEERSIPFTVDPRMVRGLDYYERTTFEVINPDLGAQDAICGGGRYDGLAEMLGSEERIPGVGFAAGLERIMLALEATGEELEFEPLCEVALVHVGKEARRRMFTLCDVLRRAGVACAIDLAERSVKAQMREANRREALIALIAGDKDLQEEKVTVKNLIDGDEEKIPFEKVVPVILERLEEMDKSAIDEEPEDGSVADNGEGPQPGEAA